ncbi:MAG: glycosyltransferase family 4 protein [candidate division Zixibacteria bacterium]|nr:glycosyltransferase family 4 protein [candidate division Zixibacteria bacterium]
MRIGVDAHVLTGKFQGSRTYLLNLYRAVTARESGHEFVFYGHWNGDKPFGAKVSYRNFPSASRWKRLLYDSRAIAKEDRIELYHSTYIAPVGLACRSLVTIHDVLFETVPEYFSKPFVWRSRFLVRRSARTADQVQTISRFSSELITSRYEVASNRVRLVAPGTDLRKFHGEGRTESRSIIRTAYAVSDYILTVGRLEPRKNHLGLIEAYAEIKRKNKNLVPLVIIGQPDFGYRSILRRIGQLGLESDVKILSNVPDDMLPHFYRAARIFVYPSFAEGFGIPVLESMACGVPTVASGDSAIPEVVGDGGLLVDPKDPLDIAKAIERILDSPELAEKLSDRARNIARVWTWERAASQYLDSIKALA